KFLCAPRILILGGAIFTGCAEAHSAGPVAGAPGALHDEGGVVQQICPADSVPIRAVKTRCAEAVLAQFAESVIQFGHQHWQPPDVVRSSDLYSNYYTGKAFLTVLRVSGRRHRAHQ